MESFLEEMRVLGSMKSKVTLPKNQRITAQGNRKTGGGVWQLHSRLDQAFWLRLFASDPSTFAPGNEVPIPSDYRIGPGDVVEIQLLANATILSAWVFPEKA